MRLYCSLRDAWNITKSILAIWLVIFGDMKTILTQLANPDFFLPKKTPHCGLWLEMRHRLCNYKIQANLAN